MEYHKSCTTLQLKVFFEIAETGNVKLLLISGKEDTVKLMDAWEDILEEYSQLDKNMALMNVMEQRETLFKQAALYCEIKAMLLYLVGGYKQEFVDRLNELGYRIDKDNLIQSIKRNDQKSNNISTRMQIIQKDIESHSTGKKSTFDQTMAFIASELGFEPNENLTVARYLAYKNQINERNKKGRSDIRRGVQLA